jgi:hypothetical protein
METAACRPRLHREALPAIQQSSLDRMSPKIRIADRDNALEETALSLGCQFVISLGMDIEVVASMACATFVCWRASCRGREAQS